MAQSSSPVSGVADRYAQSLFELARDNGAVETVESELVAFQGLIDESADFRRLVESPAFTSGEHRGEIAAEVTSAHPLTDEQRSQLAEAVGSYAGKTVTMRESVDPAILGGLIVRIGSRQVDTSLRTKLNSLKLALKEVG